MTQSNVSNSRTERRFDTNSVLECVCLSVCLSVCVCVCGTDQHKARSVATDGGTTSDSESDEDDEAAETDQ